MPRVGRGHQRVRRRRQFHGGSMTIANGMMITDAADQRAGRAHHRVLVLEVARVDRRRARSTATTARSRAGAAPGRRCCRPSRGRSRRRRQAGPAGTPTSFSGVAGSWRVICQVIRKANTGETELRIAAGPASTHCWPHATRTNGNTVQASPAAHTCARSAPSRGSGMPRIRRTAIRSRAAMPMRPDIKVTGGIDSRPIFTQM